MFALKRHRWRLWLALALLVALVSVIVAMRMACVTIERIAWQWLGDQGQAADIDIGWRTVVLRDVVIRAPEAWPAKHALTADSVTFHPRWIALLSNRVEIADITVQGYRLTALRPRDGGIEVLPSLRARVRERKARGNGHVRTTHIGKLTFSNGHLDFYDAQISQPPHYIPLTRVNAIVGPLDFPGLTTQTRVDISGDFGENAAGRLRVLGTLTVGTFDADIDTALTGIAVQHLAPYLQRGTKVAFKRGVIDLSLASTVRNRHITAPGTLTLSNLELANDGLASLPRKAAIAALEDKKGRATFQFKLIGPLAKPAFTLEEGVSARIAGGLAGALGISIEGLAHGIGGTIESVGGALSNMFGGGN